MTREDGRERRRTTVYLQLETADALARYCSAEGRERSVVVDEAVRELLARKGAS